MSNPDLIAQAAHPDLQAIWSPLANVHLEREWWIAIMVEQQRLGVDIPDRAIDASCLVQKPSSTVLQRIHQRELKTKHDLKARLEIFCEDAGHEHHHLGMTSADVVENVLQIKVARSLRWLEWQYDLGVERQLKSYPLRGIKGPVGTQQDQLDLLGSYEACVELDRRVAEQFGFSSWASCVPQVMWRSLDLQIVAALAVAATTRRSESPLCAVLRGFMAMSAAIAGDTWNEGDVASSVVRRVCIPGAIYTTDLICRGALP